MEAANIAVSGFFLLFLVLAGALVFMVPVLIGLYVYKDAKSRGMDATLWALVAALVPSFIGLIIYFVVRGNNINLKCAGCASPAASDWKLCPKCGETLPEQQSMPAVHGSAKRDRKILWILAAAIAVPVLFLAMGIFGLMAYNTTTSSSMLGSGLPVGYEDESIFPDVANWMAECDEKGDGIYVLKLSPEKARELMTFTSPPSGDSLKDADHIYCAVIYINEKGRVSGGAGMDQRNGILKMTYSSMDIIGVAEEKIPDYELSYVLFCNYGGRKRDNVNKLQIFIDGNAAAFELSVLK
jgi:hypothetical protein